MTHDRQDVGGLEGGEVEHDVRRDLFQGTHELSLVGPVKGDIAGEGAVRTILTPCGDSLHAAAHQLLARSDADEPRAANDERAGQRSRAVNSTSTPSSPSSRVAISRAMATDRCLPPVHPKATTRLDRPRSR